jgi:hypothetical protein
MVVDECSVVGRKLNRLVFEKHIETGDVFFRKTSTLIRMVG